MFCVGGMLVYRRFPTSSCMCPYDMVLIIITFLMHSHIHVYCLIYVMHKQMLLYQFVRIICVPYISWLWIFLTVQYMHCYMCCILTYIFHWDFCGPVFLLVVGVLYLWLRAITMRYKEHVRYVRTNNPTSAYALHILNNKHEYGNATETLKLLKPCHKAHTWTAGKPSIYKHSTNTKHWLLNNRSVISSTPSMSSQTCHVSLYIPPDSVPLCTSRNTHATLR